MYKLILVEVNCTTFPTVMNGETIERSIREMFVDKNDSFENMFRFDENTKPCPLIYHLNE